MAIRDLKTANSSPDFSGIAIMEKQIAFHHCDMLNLNPVPVNKVDTFSTTQNLIGWCRHMCRQLLLFFLISVSQRKIRFFPWKSQDNSSHMLLLLARYEVILSLQFRSYYHKEKFIFLSNILHLRKSALHICFRFWNKGSNLLELLNLRTPFLKQNCVTNFQLSQSFLLFSCNLKLVQKWKLPGFLYLNIGNHKFCL